MLDQRRRELGVVDPPLKKAISSLMRNPVPSVKIEMSRPTQEEADQRELAMRREACIRDLVNRAGARYRDCRLNNFVAKTDYQKKVIARLGKYIENFKEHVAAGEGLVLYGPVGTGKDHLAFSIAGHMAWHGPMTASWLNVQDWFGTVRDAMDSGRRERDLISDISNPSILVLSDPSPPIGQLTQHQCSMLYRAVDARYTCVNKITIVTVNVASDEEADNKLGAATWDRLCHKAIKIACQWRSYRSPKEEMKP